MDTDSLTLPQSTLVVPQSMKSSPSAGGPPPCFQAVHMVTACPRASTKQHGPYVLLQRGIQAAHAFPLFVEGMALR